MLIKSKLSPVILPTDDLLTDQSRGRPVNFTAQFSLLSSDLYAYSGKSRLNSFSLINIVSGADQLRLLKIFVGDINKSNLMVPRASKG